MIEGRSEEAGMAAEHELSEGTRRLLAEVAAADGATSPLDIVRGIRSLVVALESDDATLAAVRAAVSGGATWDEVARAAGLGLAAAKWRWQGTDNEIAERHEAGRKAFRPAEQRADRPARTLGGGCREAARRHGPGGLPPNQPGPAGGHDGRTRRRAQVQARRAGLSLSRERCSSRRASHSAAG